MIYQNTDRFTVWFTTIPDYGGFCFWAVADFVSGLLLMINPLKYVFRKFLRCAVSPAELGDSTVYIAFRAAADWTPGSIEPLGHRRFDS